MKQARHLTAATAVLALVASLPLVCSCAPRPAAHTGAQHDCCAPPAGVKAVDAGCCGGASTALPGALGSPAPFPAPNPGAVVRFAFEGGAGRTGLVPLRPAFAVAPSPPTILRI